MGYDMHWRTKDADEAAAVEAARMLWDRAIEERNAIPASERGRYNPQRTKQDRLDPNSHAAYDGRTERYIAAFDKARALYEAMRDAEQSYFRLNVFSMSAFADLMERLGMVFEDEPHPPFPKPDEFGVAYEDVEALEYPEDYPDVTWTDERLTATLKFRDAQQAVLDFHGKTDTPGIPAHKFSSNDGWHVLPAEATAAARIWQKFVDDHGQDDALHLVENSLGSAPYWLKWVAWVAASAKHDGFEVH